MFEKIKSLICRESIRQIIRYAVVGGLTTLVNISVFFWLDKIIGLNTTAANVISVITSVLFAYAANKLFVFRTRGLTGWELLQEILSFFSARAVTMLLEVGGVYVLAGLLRVDSMIAKVALNVVVIILNYVFSKLFVFKKT